MDSLTADLPVSVVMGVCGGLVGLLAGYVARSQRFCTLSAIETAVYGNSWGQARMWMLAIALAMVGTNALHVAGLVDLTATFHLAPRIAWLGPVVGGVMFGLGMAAVGNCGFGCLLRAAGGDMRAMMVVLVIAISGYMTIRGLLALARIPLIEPTTIPLAAGQEASLPAVLAGLFGGGPDDWRATAALAVCAVILIWVLRDAAFRRRPALIATGIAIGLLVVAGWGTTGILGADPFDPQPLQSLGFIAPVGRTVIYLMTYTGATIDFGIATILGVIAGGFLAAVRRRDCRLEAFDDAREMRRHLAGGLLMGIGGVVSMGCTIGQGLSGLSTLALPSALALVSMVAGAVLGLKLLVMGGFSVPVMRLRTHLHLGRHPDTRR